MRFSRFERKILAALIAVAVVPTIGALVLGERALREAYEVGVNPRVEAELERGLALHRSHIAELRSSANQVADMLASDYALLTALSRADEAATRERLAKLVEGHEAVLRVELEPASTAGLSIETGARRAPDGLRLLELQREVELDPSYRMAITVGAPAEAFADYQRAGEMFEVFTRLEASGRQVSLFYLLVYMGFLLSVIVVAVAVGIVISRRVTRRVAILAEATARVGAGDLTVQVPSEVDDEIGELTQAFNAMVRDMQRSRGRIEYLQRIGAWQEFARRLAHEIKNPLTPIQLAVQEVNRSYSGGDLAFKKRLDDALSIVEEEVATLRLLVGEFSAFARLPRASLQPADLNDFLRDAGRSLGAVAQELRDADRPAEVTVQCRPSQGELPVRIDAMMLKRGLDNLVRNAAQAIAGQGTAERPATGTVTVSCARDDGFALIHVSDDGPGIAEPDRARIFDPYFTTKGDGTGLGLAIVKKVVLEHGGDISCGAADGGGAVFSIRLPIT